MSELITTKETEALLEKVLKEHKESIAMKSRLVFEAEQVMFKDASIGQLLAQGAWSNDELERRDPTLAKNSRHYHAARRYVQENRQQLDFVGWKLLAPPVDKDDEEYKAPKDSILDVASHARHLARAIQKMEEAKPTLHKEQVFLLQRAMKPAIEFIARLEQAAT